MQGPASAGVGSIGRLPSISLSPLPPSPRNGHCAATNWTAMSQVLTCSDAQCTAFQPGTFMCWSMTPASAGEPNRSRAVAAPGMAMARPGGTVSRSKYSKAKEITCVVERGRGCNHAERLIPSAGEGHPAGRAGQGSQPPMGGAGHGRHLIIQPVWTVQKQHVLLFEVHIIITQRHACPEAWWGVALEPRASPPSHPGDPRRGAPPPLGPCLLWIPALQAAERAQKGMDFSSHVPALTCMCDNRSAKRPNWRACPKSGVRPPWPPSNGTGPAHAS